MEEPQTLQSKSRPVFFAEAPYVDTRASLTDGPETRHYRARYLKKDTVTADFSDVLVVTVPGKA